MTEVGDESLSGTETEIARQIRLFEERDGLHFGFLSDQVTGGLTLVDPVTGLRESEVKSQTKWAEARLRLFQSAYIYQARREGFDPEDEVLIKVKSQEEKESVTGAYYQEAERFVTAENQRIAEELSQEGIFYPTEYFWTGEELDQSSLRLFRVLQLQSRPDERISEEEYRSLQEEYGDLQRFGSHFYQNDFDYNFYRYRLGLNIDLCLRWSKVDLVGRLRRTINPQRLPDLFSLTDIKQVISRETGRIIDRLISDGTTFPKDFFEEQGVADDPLGKLVLLCQIENDRRPELEEVLIKERGQLTEKGARQQEIERKEKQRRKEESFNQRVARRRRKVAQLERERLTSGEGQESFLSRARDWAEKFFGLGGISDFIAEGTGFVYRISSFLLGSGDQYEKRMRNYRERFSTRYGFDPSILDQYAHSSRRIYRPRPWRDLGWVIANLFTGFRGLNGLTLVSDDQYAVELRNMREIKRLERRRPGICRYLNKEFNLLDFARLPRQMLIDQYDHRYKQERQPVLIFLPVYDYTAFYTNRRELKRTTRQIKTRFEVRFIEWKSGVDIVRGIVASYMDHGSPALVWIHGHGAKGELQGSPNRDRELFDIVRTEHLGGKGVGRVDDLLAEGAPVVLNSCSVGSPGGLAQELSRVWENHNVYASKDVASNIKIRLTTKGGRISLKSARYNPIFTGLFGIPLLGWRKPLLVYRNGAEAS